MVTLDTSTEVAQLAGFRPGGIVMSWEITFSTNDQARIVEIADPAMGDIVRIEEYDFNKNSIKLL